MVRSPERLGRSARRDRGLSDISPSSPAKIAVRTDRVRGPAEQVCEKWTLTTLRKRPGIAHRLVVDTHFGPIPGQEFIEPAHGVAIGHTLQDVPEIGEGLHVVELCRGDEGANGSPSLSATIRAGEQMVLAP